MERVLLVVRYASDVERKRLEYLLNRFQARVRGERVHGSVVMLEGDMGDIESLIRELYARIPRDRVEVYRVERFDVDVEPFRREGRVVTGMTPEAVWGVVEFLVRKLRGVPVGGSGASKKYRLYVKGGVVDVTFTVRPREGGSLVEYVVEGYDGHVDSVYGELERELGFLMG